MNNEDTTDSKHSKNFSLSKKKIKPIAKEIAHVRADHERYHSINTKETHNNSILITNTLKEISILINEIQEIKRSIYITNDQNKIRSNMKIIKLKISTIEQKVKKNKINFNNINSLDL